MTTERHLMRRRQLLRGLSVAALYSSLPHPAWAAELVRTPRQTAGPFYPERLPLDTDNDLVVINDAAAAGGEITWLSGRILNARGEPIRNAIVEIWQVDQHGVYLHPGSGNANRRDAGFQGYGKFETGASGEYLFRTIKPVPYPGRTPHIHVGVKTSGSDDFTTQCYIEGEPLNARDAILNSVRDPQARAALIVPFVPVRESRRNELAARFDIVLGVTPNA